MGSGWLLPTPEPRDTLDVMEVARILGPVKKRGALSCAGRGETDRASCCLAISVTLDRMRGALFSGGELVRGDDRRVSDILEVLSRLFASDMAGDEGLRANKGVVGVDCGIVGVKLALTVGRALTTAAPLVVGDTWGRLTGDADREVLAELGFSTLPYDGFARETGLLTVLVAFGPLRTFGVAVVFTFAFGLKVDIFGGPAAPKSFVGEGDRATDGGGRMEEADGLGL